MTTDQRPLGPELILEKNDVYTRWLHLQQREHPREADAALQVSEDLGVTIEVVDDGIFAGQLTEAEIRCRDAAGRYEDARAERNAMVLKAISRRWTHAQIALATGLTRARVGQIALTDGSTNTE